MEEAVEAVTPVEWVDELPGKPYDDTHRGSVPNKPQERSRDLYEHAEALKGHPMRWAKYPRPLKGAYSARRTADAIREGTIGAYSRRAGFQACSREGECYIRYNPESVDPHEMSYWEGYRQGRKDAMADVHAALWDFRQTVTGIEGWEESRAEESKRGSTVRPARSGGTK